MSSFVNDVVVNFKDVVFNKYVRFDGRADRTEFWHFVLAEVIIGLTLSVLAAIFSKVAFIAVIFKFISFIVNIGLFLPSVAVSVRRLSDIGKGWPWIFVNFIPVVGSIWFLILMATPSK